MKIGALAAVGVVGATLVAAPLAPAQAHGFCGPFLPLCIAGAVVGAAATVATLPLAVASAPYGYAPAYSYGAPPAYYAPAAYPAYYGSPYYAYPYPYYYGGGPYVSVGYGRPFFGHPRFWHRRHF